MTTVHGTCIAIDGRAVLLRGPSGCGKSDLALRLIDAGGLLVADDYAEVERRNGRVVLRAPDALAGMLEVRGLGVLRFDYLGEAALDAVIDLVPPDQVDRMPQPAQCDDLGAPVPLFRLHAFEPSAPAKVRMALKVAGRDILTVD